MSNEQTVREAIADALGWQPQHGSREATGIDTLAEWIEVALGIDPDMSVSELQRRLRIADRVLLWQSGKATGKLDEVGTLAWLVKDDQ